MTSPVIQSLLSRRSVLRSATSGSLFVPAPDFCLVSKFSAPSASAVRPSEKSSINTNRKSLTRFPTSLRWSSYVAPKSHNNVPFDNTTPIYLINLPWKLGLDLKLHYFGIFTENKKASTLSSANFTEFRAKRTYPFDQQQNGYRPIVWVPMNTLGNYLIKVGQKTTSKQKVFRHTWGELINGRPNCCQTESNIA